MKHQSKRAFTLVELVVVMAIIAILAALFIPTFVTMVKRANETSDTQVIRNLNKALQLETKKHGEVFTAFDAFTYAENQGYKVATIVVKSGYNIAYDVVEKRFVLLDLAKKTALFPIDVDHSKTFDTTGTEINYFVVCKDDKTMTEVTSKQYSVYWANEEAPKNTTIAVGFDAGKCEKITAVTFATDAALNAVVRTGSFASVLTVNAPLATVNQYGETYLLNNKAGSLRICGTVGRLAAEQGKAEVAADGVVFSSSGVAVCEKNHHGDMKFVTDGVNVYCICTVCGYAVAPDGTASANAPSVFGTLDLSGETDLKKIGACDHTFGEPRVLTPATEETTGVAVMTCDSCGFRFTYELPVIVVEETNN